MYCLIHTPQPDKDRELKASRTLQVEDKLFDKGAKKKKKKKKKRGNSYSMILTVKTNEKERKED